MTRATGIELVLLSLVMSATILLRRRTSTAGQGGIRGKLGLICWWSFVAGSCCLAAFVEVESLFQSLRGDALRGGHFNSDDLYRLQLILVIATLGRMMSLVSIGAALFATRWLRIGVISIGIALFVFWEMALRGYSDLYIVVVNHMW
jgi:hypothetical protein